MDRRSFIRNLALSPVVAANLLGGVSYLSMMREAHAANGKTLIVVFQRGGCDGLNAVVPYIEDEYYSLRPDIAIKPPDSGIGSAIDLNGFFGLHPSLQPLYEIYQQGNMAILPAVHYPNGNRSHFSSQDYIESGSSNKRTSNGWLNRYLSSVNVNTQLRAASFGELNHALKGPADVVTIKDLSVFEKGGIDDTSLALLDKIFKQPGMEDNISRQLLKKHGSTMLKNSYLLSSLNYKNYVPRTGAAYPNSDLGKQMRQIAHLIKSDIGLEVITVNSNGWDHHANQGGYQGNQADKLTDFSTSIAALYKDLGSVKMNNVVILTMTEFGRTVKQNSSGGTDHGNASSWFVIGGEINGGIHGVWPGIAPEKLYLDRYLKHTVDTRDVFAEIISSHFGNKGGLPYILPNHNYQPIGFL